LPDLAFISLGSNIEPEIHLPRAIIALAALGRVVEVSNVYQNPALSSSPQADFLNAAALLETDLQPLEIRRILRGIEAVLGRVRSEDKYAPRTIDLDLCLFGDLEIESENVTLPDPELLSRAYLAIPMAELAPDFPHPVTHEPLAKIAARLRRGANLNQRPDVRKLFPMP
jgi:2-amino-4-hydroxy-6-hydroxymethyldihydropteridine diphosphokinase